MEKTPRSKTMCQSGASTQVDLKKTLYIHTTKQITVNCRTFTLTSRLSMYLQNEYIKLPNFYRYIVYIYVYVCIIILYIYYYIYTYIMSSGQNYMLNLMPCTN
jgi:hypothetical protein